MELIDNKSALMLLQTVRMRIAKLLLGEASPLYVEQIARRLEESPRLVAHHLELLEDFGFVESRFEVIVPEGSKRKVAARFFKPTQKLKDVYEKLSKTIEIERVELDR
ncbi:MAG: helix-turn-helix domain-containing protein [Conexivisphaerales archaeon]